MKRVALIMGSESDLTVMREAAEQLKALGIPFAARVLSAHRTPETAAAFARSAADAGYGVLIAGAGKAAHLAGALAANTTLPVIGVPIQGSAFAGMDALLSTVQMPGGIPVATVAVNGAKNAALLAAEILALGEPALAAALWDLRANMRAQAEEADRRVAGTILTTNDSFGEKER